MKIVVLILIALGTLNVKSFAKTTKTLVLSDEIVAIVPISLRGAILNFPSKPKKVVVGNKSAFVIDYIGNDVILSPLFSGARSNIFIYLEGRRFNIDATAKQLGHTIIQVRDKFSSNPEVYFEKR